MTQRDRNGTSGFSGERVSPMKALGVPTAPIPRPPSGTTYFLQKVSVLGHHLIKHGSRRVALVQIVSLLQEGSQLSQKIPKNKDKRFPNTPVRAEEPHTDILTQGILISLKEPAPPIHLCPLYTSSIRLGSGVRVVRVLRQPDSRRIPLADPCTIPPGRSDRNGFQN